MHLGAHALIGNLNYITGEPAGSESYARNPERRPELVLSEHSAITSRHSIDCTDTVSIGPFGVLGGWRCQILSHSFDIEAGSLRCAPVKVGGYSIVSTNSVLLMGASLPDHSVLGAMSLLKDDLTEPYRVYAGNPAREVSVYEPDAAFFSRSRGPIT
jgi:acetyltransferase-like isoleucine patch superfamily enzyme